MIPFEGAPVKEFTAEQKKAVLRCVENFIEYLPAGPLKAKLDQVEEHIDESELGREGQDQTRPSPDLVRALGLATAAEQAGGPRDLQVPRLTTFSLCCFLFTLSHCPTAYFVWYGGVSVMCSKQLALGAQS